MVDVVTIQQKIVGDDPAMTSPPNCLRAHQGDTLFVAEAHEFIESRTEV
jgi:hypothetical protein